MLAVAAFLVLLGVLITVHELGHFLAAKLTGVKVLTFSIGFGPRLIGFRIGDTDYRISLLPLGGYVSMYGDDVSQDVPDSERHRAFLHKPFLSKSFISVAGPLANLLLPVALFFGLYVGEEKVADAVVGTVIPGEPAAAAGIQAGDRIVRVGGQPVQVFSDLQEVITTQPGVPVRLGLVRHGEPLEVTLTPRAAASPTPFDSDRKVGRIGIVAGRELPFVVVEQGSPAWAAGLRTNDRVTALNGSPITTRGALLTQLDALPDAAWSLAVQRGPTPEEAKAGAVPRSLEVAVPVAPGVVPALGEGAFAVTRDEALAVAHRDATIAATTRAAAERAARRGLSPVDGWVRLVVDGTAAKETGLTADKDRVVAVDGHAVRMASDIEAALQSAPDAIHTIGVLGDSTAERGGARVITLRMGPHPQRQLKSLRVLGAGFADATGEPAVVVRDVGPVAAFGRAIEATGDTVVDVVKGFGLLFSGKVGLESLGGPITIFNLAGQAAQTDAATFLHMMALLSINLFVLNLLPIPVLDGGHLMMFIVEAVQRRRLTMETRIKATKIGLVLVGLLMAIAIGNDLLGLF